jgi:hypothetical protein
MPIEGGKASATQRQRWEHGRRELKWRMLAPLLGSPHLRPLEKILAAIELTMPTMVSLIGIFLLLSCVTCCRLPAMLAGREYLFATLIGVSATIALLAIGVLGLSPFLLSLVPWRIGHSLLYFPYYAAWKMLLSLKARPDSWVRTGREYASHEPDSPDGIQRPHRVPRQPLPSTPGRNLEI